MARCLKRIAAALSFDPARESQDSGPARPTQWRPLPGPPRGIVESPFPTMSGRMIQPDRPTAGPARSSPPLDPGKGYAVDHGNPGKPAQLSMHNATYLQLAHFGAIFGRVETTEKPAGNHRESRAGFRVTRHHREREAEQRAPEKRTALVQLA